MLRLLSFVLVFLYSGCAAADEKPTPDPILDDILDDTRPATPPPPVAPKKPKKKKKASPLSSVIDKHGKRHYFGLHHKAGVRHGVAYWAPKIMMSAPAEYDLRKKGFVAPIKDQGQCGSCWAFSVTKSLESAMLASGMPYADLSEQELVSCDTMAAGCNGGSMDDLSFAVKHGLPLEKDFPYAARTLKCKNPEPTVAERGMTWGYIGAQGREPTIDEIKQALLEHGVLSVIVSAGGQDWMDGGHMTRCDQHGQNHMINIVGWTAQDELILANSWGTGWGDEGFAYAKQHCDEVATGSESVGFVAIQGPTPIVTKISLPAEVDVHPGTEIALGSKTAVPGVSYAWYQDNALLPDTGSLVWLTPSKTAVYKVRATNAAGVVEASTNVKVLTSAQ